MMTEWKIRHIGHYLLEVQPHPQRGVEIYFDEIVDCSLSPTCHIWEIYLEDRYVASLSQETNTITNLEQYHRGEIPEE